MLILQQRYVTFNAYIMLHPPIISIIIKIMLNKEFADSDYTSDKKFICLFLFSLFDLIIC